MSFALAFWLIMIICFILSLYFNWPKAGTGIRPLGNHLIIFILLFLLGWKVFGAPLHP